MFLFVVDIQMIFVVGRDIVFVVFERGNDFEKPFLKKKFFADNFLYLRTKNFFADRVCGQFFTFADSRKRRGKVSEKPSLH